MNKFLRLNNNLSCVLGAEYNTYFETIEKNDGFVIFLIIQTTEYEFEREFAYFVYKEKQLKNIISLKIE